MSVEKMLMDLARDAGGHSIEGDDWFVGMDRDTFRAFMGELQDVHRRMQGLSAPDMETVKLAHETEAAKTGMTKINYMGLVICICPWVRGLAIAPYSTKVNELTRAFVTGYIR